LWPEVTKEVKQYVEEYDQCQKIKNRTEMPAEKLRLNAVPEKPWQHISVDFITKLLVYILKLTIYCMESNGSLW